ncbi:hypothetical protein KQY30_06140 [Streptomyces sp. GMY02]|uniref:hypothetical protein n=1 Tax=Streptomyces sp. GMY02 TaxID=1333528 RepID=UPI001C2C133B|nr:hypothetical protein [Streptomyces sp. GMY02]QXE38928.1 hypothetical protein KQY30_06140 [Streptomyces sp. GMY02]
MRLYRRRLGAGERFRRLYGESPLQLLLLLASFALCAYAGIRLLSGDWLLILIWFVGAAVLHDLVLVPLYSLGDRGAEAALRPGRERPGRDARGERGPGVNHLRVPAFLSLLLLLVYWPLVLRASKPYEDATRLSIDVFLGRWLLITAALFALSAVWLVVRLYTDRRRAHAGVEP